MTTFDVGRKAERAAATYLEMRGYRILERNWRRPRCEIDIIAEKDSTIYFVEVKYRRDDAQGGGLEAVTPTKLRQMRYAATSWLAETKWRGPSQLAAIELSGPNYTVLSFIDDVF
ncbi:MAG TPA: YraN family protein [Candidatus Saccharimonadales bacterium]|jgi:putative endonuclease|nr:YraN family protein [Candidatus Saccharimonadales bacterium]